MHGRSTPAEGINKELDVWVPGPAEVHLEEDTLLSLAVHADGFDADGGVAKLQLAETQLVHEWRLHTVKDGLADLLNHTGAVVPHSHTWWGQVPAQDGDCRGPCKIGEHTAQTDGRNMHTGCSSDKRGQAVIPRPVGTDLRGKNARAVNTGMLWQAWVHHNAKGRKKLGLGHQVTLLCPPLHLMDCWVTLCWTHHVL